MRKLMLKTIGLRQNSEGHERNCKLEAVPPGYSRSDAKIRIMKKWKAICIGMFAAAVIGFYFVTPQPEAGAGLRADQLCKTLLAEKENREALSWLEQSK